MSHCGTECGGNSSSLIKTLNDLCIIITCVAEDMPLLTLGKNIRKFPFAGEFVRIAKSTN